MELEQFVTEALRQIITGVKAAQEAVAETGGEVGPRFNANQSTWDGYVEFYNELQPVFKVGFDVAVIATEGTKTQAGIGVVAGIVALGSQGKSEQTSAVVSRLKFEVPIVYPRGKERPRNTR